MREFRDAARDQAPGPTNAYAKALCATGDVDAALTVLAPLADRHPESAFLSTVYAFETRSLADNRRRFAAMARRWPPHPPAQLAAGLIDVLAGAEIQPGDDPRAAAFVTSARWLAETGAGTHFGSAARLLEACLDTVSEQPGLYCEFGVYWGRSIRQIAARSERTVHGFDSFEGLPEDWKPGEPAGAYSTGGKIPEVPENVVLHRGWFKDTVADFLTSQSQPVAFAHVDCDLYSSARTVLDALTPHLAPGAVVLFDDFLGFPGYREHEFRAFVEWSRETGRPWRVLGHAFLGREVGIRLG